MKMYRILAGASAAALALGMLTACSKKQEEVPKEEPIIQEETLEQVPTEEIPNERPVVEFPLEEENSASEEETDENSNEQLSENTLTVQVAELVEFAEDGSLMIMPYGPADETADIVIEDYANVDFSSFIAGEESQQMVLSENVLFRMVQEGELVETDEETMLPGSMLIITTDAEGLQTVVIYHPAAE